MPKKRKNQTAARRAALSFDSPGAQQLSLFGVPEHQASTCQVPCGDFSIFAAREAREVTQAEFWVYQVLNKDSNWETGRSHARSYAQLEKSSGMKRSAVIACVNGLVEKGWIEKNVRNATGKHSQNVANTYRLIHHKCQAHEVPLDTDDRPKKCAVPRGPGSPFQMVEDGIITWKEALYWISAKIESDWVSGVVEMTIKQAKHLLGMTTQTICRIRKKIERVGLVEKTSKAFRKWTAILLPKPYAKRRKRRHETRQYMKSDDDFYYSHNGLWKVSRADGHIETKIEGPGDKWRYASEFELEKANDKIYKDFKPIIELVTSPYYRGLAEQLGT